jgi:hypothetical protein
MVMKILICSECKKENPDNWICQHATAAGQWRSAIPEDVGRLGRFKDRESDDAVYAMLVGVDGGKFMAQYTENDTPESFFYCEVQAT